MADAVAGGKTCIVCGADVSGKPRVKDAQGRYVCAGECQQKLAAKHKAEAGAAARSTSAPRPSAPPTSSRGSGGRAGAAESGGVSMSDLIASSPMLSATNCPSCSNPMNQGAVICTRCGFNTTTGKAVHTKISVEKAPKEKGVKMKSGNRYATDVGGWSFGKWFLIQLGVLSVVALAAALGPGVALGSFVVILLAGLVATIAGIIAAFKNEQNLWGWMGALQLVPFVGLVGSVGFLIYNLIANEDAFSKALYWTTVLAMIIWGVAAVMGNGGVSPFAALSS